MKLDPKDLEANGYVLMDRLDHQEIIPFVRENLRKPTWFAMGYTLVNVFMLGLTLVMIWLAIDAGRATIGDLFTRIAFGMAIALALIPVHEFIHGLAYKGQGAPRTSYTMNLRKFYFLAVADQFVANRREFSIVALAPFMTVTIISLAVFTIADLPLRLTVMGVLLTHTAFCSGDFGLLSYFEANRHRDLVTYDDQASGLTYFYGRPA